MIVVIWSLAAAALCVAGLHIVVRLRARNLLGRPVTGLKGELGEAVASGEKVLAYFYSPECAACRPQTPIMDSLRTTHRNVYTVNVVQDQDTSRVLRVVATPSTILLEKGAVREFRVGAVSTDVLRAMLR
jgi:thioredoxin 1